MRYNWSVVAAVASAILITGCGERPTVTSPGFAAHRDILAGPEVVHVISRNTPLPTSQSSSAVIGAFGGRITLPGAGLTVIVPPFAVTSPVQITVTAVAGSQVAYEFEPHGSRFLVPLVVTQSLSGTDALSGGLLPRPLVAGYFATLSDLDPLAGTASVSELLNASASLLTQSVTFSIVHFSGYLIATGDEGTSGTSQ